MTTVIDSNPRGSTVSTTHRTLNVVRLQFINTQTFIWLPLLIFVSAWLLSLAVWWTITDVADLTGASIYLGLQQAPLWYFLPIGVQALTRSYPFSQAMSITRREFFTGSVLAASISAVGLATLFTLLGFIELQTDGFGKGWYFGYIRWFWEHGTVVAWLVYLFALIFAFTLGFWFATIQKKLGTVGLVVTIIVLAAALIGTAVVITWQQTWPNVVTVFSNGGPGGLATIFAGLSIVLGVVSYFTLRKLPA